MEQPHYLTQARTLLHPLSGPDAVLQVSLAQKEVTRALPVVAHLGRSLLAIFPRSISPASISVSRT